MKNREKDNKVVAIANTRGEAKLALASLKNQGIPGNSITLMSSEPIHLQDNGDASDSKSLINICGIVGGIVGAALAIALTVWTSRSVNLVTGGMPIVSPWALGVIVFEMTALGAILTIVGRMLFEARLLNRDESDYYHEAISQGAIVMTVESDDPALLERAESILRPIIQTKKG